MDLIALRPPPLRARAQPNADLAAALADPRVGGASAGGLTVRDVVERLPQFRLDPSTYGAPGSFVPETRGAADLLNGAHGDAVAKALEGIARLVSTEQFAPNGLTLQLPSTLGQAAFGQSVSTIGWQVNSLHEARARGVLDEQRFDQYLRDVGAGALADKPPPPSHVKTLGTTMNHTTLRPLVQLWPDVGRAIADPDRRGARTLTQVSQVIRHELEHVRACLPGIAIGGPLEEGIAETLTRWPGVPRQSRDLLGFPTTGPSKPWAYPRETDAVRRLLRAGGIDTRDASDRQEALEALRGSSPDETPFALARLVAGERHMDDTSTNELAHGISAAFDGRDRPDLAVRRLVDGLPPRSR